jgi:hypothetical protein
MAQVKFVSKEPMEKLEDSASRIKFLIAAFKALKLPNPSPGDLLAFVDPGVNTGYCILDICNQELHIGTVKHSNKSGLFINGSTPAPERRVAVIWEKPKLYDDRRDNADALFKMSFMGGLLFGSLGLQVLYTYAMPVQEAQGSMDKTTRHARISAMTASTKVMPTLSENDLSFYDNHALDAVYMAVNTIMNIERRIKV